MYEPACVILTLLDIFFTVTAFQQKIKKSNLSVSQNFVFNEKMEMFYLVKTNLIQNSQ